MLHKKGEVEKRPPPPDVPHHSLQYILIIHISFETILSNLTMMNVKLVVVGDGAVGFDSLSLCNRNVVGKTVNLSLWVRFRLLISLVLSSHLMSSHLILLAYSSHVISGYRWPGGL